MMVKLPWPPRGLWPNYRHHWASMARAKRNYRSTAWALAKEEGGTMAGRLAVHLTFCPPDKRRRDMDNMLAAMKAGLDGISQAIGVDDSLWSLSLRVGDIVPGGAVYVTLDGAP